MKETLFRVDTPRTVALFLVFRVDTPRCLGISSVIRKQSVLRVQKKRPRVPSHSPFRVPPSRTVKTPGTSISLAFKNLHRTSSMVIRIPAFKIIHRFLMPTDYRKDIFSAMYGNSAAIQIHLAVR